MVKVLLSCAIMLLIVGNVPISQPNLQAAETAPGTASVAGAAPSPADLGIHFVKNSTSAVVMERNGKQYMVDLVTRTVREAGASDVVGPGEASARPASAFRPQGNDGSQVFAGDCAACHGPDGKGLGRHRTPDLTDPRLQASLTDAKIFDAVMNGKPGTEMPAWRDKLSEQDIKAVASYVRSLGAPRHPGAGQAPAAQSAEATKPKVYEPGDDVLFSLPTGRRLDRHGFYVDFAHRFAYDPAFSDTARGGALIGLDGFAIPSFGFRYGFTDKLSGSVFRAPSIIARPIQFMLAYNFADEHDGYPLNAVFRVSIEGQNDFAKNYTENFEGIFSRSIKSRAQIYVVPTLSLNDRKLTQINGFRSQDIPTLPGYNAFSLGVGGALDVRPTVALVAEVIPTLVNGRPLGIHRPAYSFGIQKKIWRHAFTFGFTNSPGTTVSQRAGTRASFLNDPTADKPGGLFVGFDLMRQIH
jgi:mono/diheme cytochrome c family protein